ncbi:hypothetical protein A4X13_0g4339 [Tilletia indica]|uniref:ATP-dependent DNA helicase n=1 Tax=Tilletia indica TaxID=43049 RepID=A0A8T8SXL0_9BASI|nr:hypothetical protein A4X13_0g4339 [Tilletia indica]
MPLTRDLFSTISTSELKNILQSHHPRCGSTQKNRSNVVELLLTLMVKEESDRLSRACRRLDPDHSQLPFFPRIHRTMKERYGVLFFPYLLCPQRRAHPALSQFQPTTSVSSEAVLAINAQPPGQDSIPYTSDWPQPVPQSLKDRCVQDFVDNTNIAVTLTCAVCARRTFSVDLLFTKQDLRCETYPISALPLDILRITDPHLLARPAHFFQYGDPALDGLALDAEGIHVDAHGTTLDICSECYRDLNKADPTLPPLALANGNVRGFLPPDLQDCTWLEERLCAKYLASAYIIRLFDWSAPMSEPERPRVMKGHACAFPLNTMSTATKLPWAVGTDDALLSCIVIGPRKPRLQDLKNVFRVRRKKVSDLLNYLRAHCKDYPQFEINQKALSSLPDDDVPELIMRHVVYQENQQVLSLFDEETAGLDKHPGILTDAEEDEVAGRTFLEHHGLIDVNGVAVPAHARAASALRNSTGQERPDLVIRHGSSFVQDYKNPGLFPGMFPTLYPWGTGGFEDQRASSLAFDTHAKYLLDLSYPGFRRHWSFIFIVANIKQRRAVHIGARLACKQQDHARFSQILNTLDPPVIKSIAEHIARGGTLNTLVGVEAQVFKLLNKCNLVSAKVPGSRAIMNRARSDIRAMIGHFGIFQLFLTVNPSATHSPVFHIFYGDQTIKLDTSRPTLPPSKERAIRVADDPVAGSDYFHFHLSALLQYLLGWDIRQKRSLEHGGLFGRMAGFFLVKEHTMRGQLHCHCLIWLEGGMNPDVLRGKMKDDDEFRDRYLRFFDDIITHGYPGDPSINTSDVRSTGTSTSATDTPPPTEMVDECAGIGNDAPLPEGHDEVPSQQTTALPLQTTALRHPRQERPPAPAMSTYRADFREDHALLAEEVQKHRHTFTCFKGGRESCRFFFPHDLNQHSSFDPESMSINLRVQNPLINWHNPELLVATRHNHDLKAVQSGKSGAAAASYITSYTTKSDETPANQVSMINTVYERLAEHMDPTADAHGLLTRCVMQFGRERQLHAQQAATYVRDLGDTMQSHTTTPMLTGQVLAAAIRLNGPLREEACSTGPTAPPVEEAGEDSADAAEPDRARTTPAHQQADHTDEEVLAPLAENDSVLNGDSSEHVLLLNTREHALQIDDYLHRAPTLAMLSFYDFVRYVALTPRPPKKPNASHHNLPASHLNAKTHVHRYTPEKPIGIPRPIYSRFPKPNGQPGHGDEYCSAMMAHFIPFSHNIPLKDRGVTWESAFAQTVFPPNALRIMANWAALSECEDARDADQLLRRRREAERSRRADEAAHMASDGTAAHGDSGMDIDVEQFLRGANVQSRETVEFSSVLNSSGWFDAGVNTERPVAPADFPTFTTSNRRVWSKEQALLEAQARANQLVPTAATGVLAEQLRFEADPRPAGQTTTSSEGASYIPPLPTMHMEWQGRSSESLLSALAVERTLTPSQTLAFTIAGRQFLDNLEGTTSTPLRMLMHGEAGTGKTVVVRLLRELMDRYGRGRQLMFVAPTGKAASAIGGLTQHAAFKLDIRQRGLTVEELELDKQDNIANRHRYLQKTFGHIRWIFFDEVSMTSCEMFSDIDQSLRIGTGKLDEPFGGVNVMFAGDFCQLPPVGASPLYAAGSSIRQNADVRSREELGRLSWLFIDKVVEFTEQKRMKDPEMAAALSRLRMRACTDADVALFNGCALTAIHGVSPLDIKHRPGLVVLANTNQTVRALNHRKAGAQAASDGRQMVISHASDKTTGALTEEIRTRLLSYTSQGKVKIGIGRLPLFVGMPVIYRGPNKSVQMGITNGAFGTVISWELSTDNFGLTTPTGVIVQFDPNAIWRLSNLPPGCLPIYPTLSSFKYFPNNDQRTVQKISRRQFPLQPGFAMTVHSAQGVTSKDGIVVDLRSGGFRTYVAASRATRREDIFLVHEIEKHHLNSPPFPAALSQELDRLRQLAIRTRDDNAANVSHMGTTRAAPQDPLHAEEQRRKKRRIIH